MNEQDSACGAHSVCDLLNSIGDASLAIFPKEIAHNIGEMKKNFLSGFRWLIDKEIDWIDARIAGSDRLREEWRASRETQNATSGSGI